MVSFTAADYAVLALFLGGILALGFSARLRGNTALQLIAAGRGLTLPAFVATLVTTWYGGILGVSEFFYKYGLSTWITLGLPYYVFAVAYALWMAGRVRHEEQISLPERLDRCFGRPAGLTAAVLVFVLGAPAAHIFMLGTLINLTTGLPLFAAATVGTVVGTLFLYKGGLLADARSNLLSFCMMYVSFIVILIVAVLKYGAPAEVVSKLPASHLAWDGGQGLAYVLSWFILGAWTFVDPGFHQRAAAARDESAARRGVLISVGFWVLFDLLSISTALYAYAALSGTPIAGTLAQEDRGVLVYPLFGDQLLPPGLKGMFFAGMFGVIYSGMVGYTLVSGATLGRDLVGRMRPGLSEARIALLTRIGIGAATVVGIVLALSIRSVVKIWYDVGGIVVPGLLIPTVAAYMIGKRPSGGVAVACLTSGSGAALIWHVLAKRDGLPEQMAGLLPIYAGLAAALAAWGIGSAVGRMRGGVQ